MQHLDLDKVINEGQFLRYCERKTLLKFFEEHIELFFDGKFWTIPYSDLNTGQRNIADVDLQRMEILKEYRGLIRDVVWLEEQGQDIVELCPRQRVLKSLSAMAILKENQS